MLKVIKPSTIHLRMFAGFRFNNIFAPPQILAASMLLLPNLQNEEMMGDGSLAHKAGLF